MRTIRIEDETGGRLLAASTNAGRYALDHAKGRDLTSGDRIEIWLDGDWIKGTIEHGHIGVDFRPGYYFLSDRGGMCGLCTGMTVRVEW